MDMHGSSVDIHGDHQWISMDMQRLSLDMQRLSMDIHGDPQLLFFSIIGARFQGNLGELHGYFKNMCDRISDVPF